jgi:ubiquinone biosynthesis protein COQ9
MMTTRSAIIAAALARADRSAWEDLRLHDVATDLGVTLNDVREHFREKEEIVDAWFDMADAAMLKAGEDPMFRLLDTRDRLERLIMAWLDALAPYRRVTTQMIMGKFEPGHLHYQIDGLKRVSRTVQWMREAAGRDAPLPWRALEETVLTGIYLTTFMYWMRDDSERSMQTRDMLAKNLARIDALGRFVPGSAPTAGVPPTGPNDINL